MLTGGPLSEGRVIDDSIQCGYHGLIYDWSRPVREDSLAFATATAIGIKAYPLVERDRFVSVWMGDPARGGQAPYGQFSRLSDPDWGVTKVRLDVKANYLLIVDNLLNFSLVAYVHNSTIGNAAVAEDAEVIFGFAGKPFV